ncbi:MAG: class I SAM-dependent methyltransferase [Betaproteobacteria bacterium]
MSIEKDLPDTTAAEAYEKYIVPALNARLAEEAVRAVALGPGERVLDLACGTGVVARIAAQKLSPGGSVAGLDFDPAMLAVASSSVSDCDGVRFEWHCASAQKMPFGNDVFDVALCLQGLQYFPDCVAALLEIRRVMNAGGRFVAVVWSSLEDCKGQLALSRALQRRDIDVASITKAYSMGEPEHIRKLCATAGFGDVDIHTGLTTSRFPSARHFIDAFAAGSLSSRAAIAKVREEERAAFYEEVDRELAQYEDADGIALPLGYLMLKAYA